MSKLKLSQVEEIIGGDNSYATIVDYLRLVQKYGTKSKFISIDPELLDVLKCQSVSSISVKLIKLYNVGLADRSYPTKNISKGRIAFLYNMK